MINFFITRYVTRRRFGFWLGLTSRHLPWYKCEGQSSSSNMLKSLGVVDDLWMTMIATISSSSLKLSFDKPHSCLVWVSHCTFCSSHSHVCPLLLYMLSSFHVHYKTSMTNLWWQKSCLLLCHPISDVM